MINNGSIVIHLRRSGLRLLVPLLIAGCTGSLPGGGEPDSDTPTDEDSGILDTARDDTDTGTDTDTGLDATTGTVEGYVVLTGQVDYSGITVSLDGTEMDTVTDKDGFFQFTDVPPGAYTVTAGLAGYTTFTSNPLAVSEGQTTIVRPITLETAQGGLHGAFQLAGQTDHSGIVVTVGGTAFSTITDDSGNWSISDIPVGNYAVHASSEGYDAVLRSDQQVLAGQTTDVPAATLYLTGTLFLRYVSGGSVDGDPAQEETVANPLLLPFVVEVVDSAGQGTNDVGVTFSVIAGGGVMSQQTVLTDETGKATSTLTLGTLAGENRVVVSSTDTPSQAVTFRCTALPDVPDHLVVTGDNQTGTVGESLPTDLAVQVLDVWSNPLSGLNVQFTVSAGNGDVNPVSVITDGTGSVTSAWTLDTVLDTDGIQSLTATVEGTAVFHVFAAANRSAPPVLIEKISGDNQLSHAGAALPDALEVHVEDAYGNPAMGWNVTWSSANGNPVPASTPVDMDGDATTTAFLGYGAPGLREFTATVNGHSVVFAATATAHHIDYMTPGRMWPSAPLDVEAAILGAGFTADAQVIWNAGGSEQVLVPTAVTSGKITVMLPSSLFSLAVAGVVPVTVTQSGSGRCLSVDFVIAGMLPDTGQTTCYLYGAAATCPAPTDYLYGQDAQFGWDLELTPSERFTRTTPTPDEPVVLDSITRLEWQGCAAGLSGDTCVAPYSGNASAMYYSDAVAYCNALVWGGKSDWRMPAILELATIVNATTSNPAAWNTWFPSVSGAHVFWSTTAIGYWEYTQAAVEFWAGNIWSEPRSEEHQVRCVRSDAAPIAPRFFRDTSSWGKPIVRDTVTGLTWEGCNAGAWGDNCETPAVWYLDWNQSVEYCDDLDQAGYTDWRLPNRMELLSIMDFKASGAMVDPEAFPQAGIAKYWTSSSTSANYAWVLDFGFVYFWDRYKFDNTDITVRCVRDGFTP